MSTTQESRSTPETPALRASDADREATVEALHRALGEGRLDVEETGDRVAAAYAARHCHELPPLLADLPTGGTTGPDAPSWADLWASLVRRARMLVTGDRSQGLPTAVQQRTAALIASLALVWLLVCAVAGAALVSA
ncbi:DUF1707 SHOCT-like domain-containing protein [Actinomycetospora sp. CA-053990]|uniref:DUF1707 SHOCT-like domain-containing protein n=1 Tax=Actinomycetospora sp. CA-053990 TaxID=3239891 RepID=UPI003D8EB82B